MLPAGQTRSTCPYCGVGCGVIIETHEGQITGVRGDPDHPANFGRLCTKGATLAQTVQPMLTQQHRLLQPLIRADRSEAWSEPSWAVALDQTAARIGDLIDAHGRDAFGVYVSGQLLTEDYYVFNKLTKGLIGTNHIDTNSRLCMSSAVAGYKKTLGADAPPACFDDIDEAATLLIIGSNTAWAHPILFRRIEDAKAKNPAMRVVVVDPRRTETASVADLYLPILPGTDVAFCHGLLHLMLWEGWVDEAYIAAHTEGFAALKAVVRAYTPQEVARICGIKMADLEKAARWFAGIEPGERQRRPTLSLYCQGLNQSSHGTEKNAAIINLHLATGQIGRPGAGPFSLTGQPNAMGGREVGGLANLLSAHRDLGNAQHRAEVAALWGVEAVPEHPGKTAVEMFEAVADGEMKGLWIVCTNPAQSLPNQNRVRAALARAELIIVQEAYRHTETTQWAHILLPAASWGEKEGTVTNSERRISRVRAAVPAPGQAKADWWIGVEVARRLEPRLRPGLPSLFPYHDAESVWNEHRASTRGRDLDITGLSYTHLETQGPEQWPMPEGALAGRKRLYEDGVFPTASGKAQFLAMPYRPVAQACDARYAFSLNTGRLRDQWHGMSRTGTLGRLFGHVPEPRLLMNPQDMARLGLADGDWVRVSSRYGALPVAVEASDAQSPMQTFLPMHWGGAFLGGRGPSGQISGGVNTLTTPLFCPSSKQPEFKHVPVKIEKLAVAWQVLGMAWLPPERMAFVQRTLQDFFASFDAVSCVPFGRERTGVLFRVSSTRVPSPEAVTALCDALEACFGLKDPQALRYADPKRGQHRAVRFANQAGVPLDQASLEAFLYAGDTQAEKWVATLLRTSQPARAYGQYLLMPASVPPKALASVSTSPQVCTCMDVSEAQISAHLSSTPGSPVQRLLSLQTHLKCGTQCGSCIPALKSWVARVAPAAASVEG